MLPIRSDLADMLRRHLAGRDAGARVWPGSWPAHASEILRFDLKAAGVPYADGDGHYRDFHSLRHRLATDLARANVPVAAAQTLMRHSTSRLTLDKYTHVQLHDVAGAVDQLPPLPGGAGRPPETAPARDTEANGPISERFAHHLPTGGDGIGHSVAGPAPRE
jgi:integrase